MQVAIYARVSTTRQADNDLSIPDQLRQARAWCEWQGHVVVKEYIEPGASATDDKRPAFQDMINDAMMKPAPFEAIIVHSLSRFFRDLVMGAMYQKKLLKAGVQLVSITQQTQNDPSGDMQRHIFMLFDEYQSKEIAKHVLRGMQENARQGYFNGSKAPFGYKTIDAGQTGISGRRKKKLAIEPREADTVREIFEHYVYGKNDMPRIGMKEIAKHLNAKGMLMRGKLWRVQKIYDILSSSTYTGWHVFNRRDSKTLKIKNATEWVKVPVPPIIEQELFDKAAKLREAWSPQKCVPRRESSPHLLTGLLKCDHCGASMVVVTGKSGKYRYYTCSGRISKGNAACPSGNTPIGKLDSFILDAFRQQIYTPQYIRKIIDDVRRALARQGPAEERLRLKKLEAELKEAEEAKTRLFEAVEKGLMELDEQLKARVQQHKARRESILAGIAGLKRRQSIPLQTLTPQKIEVVSNALIKRLTASTPYSRAYLRLTLKEIRLQRDFVRLIGSRASMANLIAMNGNIEAQPVPGFIPDWRARRDSNS